MMIILSKVPVRPEKREDFIEKARPSIDGSRKEDGNISYNLYKSTENDSDLLYVELWRDKAAIDAHVKAPHFLAFRQLQKDEDMVDGKRDIKLYEVKE